MHTQTRIDDGQIAYVQRMSQPEPCPMFKVALIVSDESSQWVKFEKWLAGGGFGGIHLGTRLEDGKEIVLKVERSDADLPQDLADALSTYFPK